MVRLLQQLDRTLGSAVLLLLLVLRWLHATFVAPAGMFFTRTVLPVWEESIKAVVRGWFAVAVRYANAASAAILALFPQGWLHRGPRAAGPEHPEAWRRWWASAAGTFNYVLEREGLAGPATPRTPRPASASSWRGRGRGGGVAANGELSEGEAEYEASGGGALTRNSQQQQQQGARSGWFGSRRRGGGSTTPSPAPSPTPRPRAEAPVAKAPHPASARQRGPAALARMSPGLGLQRGDALFELPAGFAIQEGLPRRGLLEEAALALELAVSRVFDAFRAAVRVLLFLSTPPEEGQSPAELLRAQLREEAAAAGRGARRRASSRGAASAAASDAGSNADLDALPRAAEQGEQAEQGEDARRSYSRSSSGRWRSPLESMGSARRWEDLHVWTASDVILRAGYPLEEHTMHRIPRQGARDVVFFQHGVLDTSLGWVANGSVGSSAFAAHDAGFDVWLANSRANPPRLHRDKARQGSRYWHFTVNQMGTADIEAQLGHIHQVKMAELQPGRWHAGKAAPPAAAADVVPADDGGGGGGSGAGESGSIRLQSRMRRSATESVIWKMRRMELAAGVGRSSDEQDEAEQQRRRQQEGSGGGIDAGGVEVRMQRPAALRRVASAADPLQALGGAAAPEVLDPTGAGETAAALAAGSAGAVGGSEASSSAGAGGAGGGACSGGGSGSEVLPYRLQAVGHSLGAACLLMFAVICRMQGQPHHLRRLILMSPAGFHSHIPIGLRWAKYTMPMVVWLVDRLLPGRGMGLRLPSPLLRYITFRFAQDLRTMPALHDLVRTFMRAATSGDMSQWDQALQMPHYNASSMPALSLHCGAHFAQWARDLSFRLFDHGSAAANRRAYGADRPPSMAEHYHLLADLPVDLVAGDADGVIAAADVRTHYERMQDAGVRATFRVMSYGHMDFTFAVRDDIREFVLSRLMRPL